MKMARANCKREAELFASHGHYRPIGDDLIDGRTSGAWLCLQGLHINTEEKHDGL